MHVMNGQYLLLVRLWTAHQSVACFYDIQTTLKTHQHSLLCALYSLVSLAPRLLMHAQIIKLQARLVHQQACSAVGQRCHCCGSATGADRPPLIPSASSSDQEQQLIAAAHTTVNDRTVRRHYGNQSGTCRCNSGADGYFISPSSWTVRCRWAVVSNRTVWVYVSLWTARTNRPFRRSVSESVLCASEGSNCILSVTIAASSADRRFARSLRYDEFEVGDEYCQSSRLFCCWVPPNTSVVAG